MFKKIIFISIVFSLGLIASVKAFDLPKNDFPRLANLYWRTPITSEDIKELAKWDLVALDMQAQTTSAENIKALKKLNPKIIILAYTSANELPQARLTEIEPIGYGLWHTLAGNIKPIWELKTYDNQNISWWPGNISMNLYPKDSRGLTYGDYLVDFYQNNILNTGLWDGLLFDNTWQNVSWVNANIDIDADGLKDGPEKIDRLWQNGYQSFFQKLRDTLKDKFLIIGNGDGEYSAYLNGRMFEGFPEFYEGGWTGSINRYQTEETTGQKPRLNIINSDTDSTSTSIEYQKMRYGLTSALMGSGYYSFDFGPKLREHFWWYDEYEVSLGEPKSEPINILNNQNNTLGPGLWKREFENGLVLVNSTDQDQTISLENEYEKIVGQQDKTINTGARINQVTIASNDGTILLRPINEIEKSVFINGSFARSFNQFGHNARTGFFAYNQKFKGGQKIIKIDINYNKTVETIIADESKITVFGETGLEIASFFPYGYKYNKGISLALYDIDNDGRLEIITGTENGGSNLIKIFNWYGKELNTGWNAYSAKWPNLGVNVVVGDTDNDGQPEIITGAGKLGGPHVKIFNINGILEKEFFAYNTNWRGGVSVAVGDINGDNLNEIVTGAGYGHEPLVRIFDQEKKQIGEWLAYQTNDKSGVNITLSDIDNNGQSEIIALTTKVFTLSSTR